MSLLGNPPEKWRSQDVRFRQGASAESIQLFEQTYGVAMPTDLKTYFLTANGMGSDEIWEWDADMLAFWPLPTLHELASPGAAMTHVAPLPTVWPSAPQSFCDLFVIGDWSIMCFAFCARIIATQSDTAEIYFYDGNPPLCIASSFTEFLHRYVEHGLNVFCAGEPKLPNSAACERLRSSR